MATELPYNECYAVVSCSDRDDTFHMVLNIRNSEHGTFRSNFELESRFYISRDFDHPYGGELEATAYSFRIDALESATKVLKKALRKLCTMNKKFGYMRSITEIMIRQLQATGCNEVRIAKNNRNFGGWNLVEPLSVKDDLSRIREALGLMENEGRTKFPYKG